MKKDKVPKKEKSEKKSDENLPVVISMFDKFEKALKMDEKGVPRSTIYTELDVSSATFYKWINNPKYWAEQYEAKPERLKRTTKEIIHSLKKKETSLDTVRSMMGDLDLNEYELEFVYHYIEKRNSTEALLRTLPPDLELTRRTVRMKAQKLMQRKNIRECIDRVLQWELEGIHITLANDIIGQLYRMAFYDPSMFIDEKGASRFKSIDDVPEEYRCCIKGIKTTFHPKDATRVYYEIQLVDKQDSMKELMQYANLYEDNNKGLINLGEGLKKVADLLERNKYKDVVDQDMKNVTPTPSMIDKKGA